MENLKFDVYNLNIIRDKLNTFTQQNVFVSVVSQLIKKSLLFDFLIFELRTFWFGFVQ
jgi:hypothetical protein